MSSSSREPEVALQIYLTPLNMTFVNATMAQQRGSFSIHNGLVAMLYTDFATTSKPTVQCFFPRSTEIRMVSWETLVVSRIRASLVLALQSGASPTTSAATILATDMLRLGLVCLR